MPNWVYNGLTIEGSPEEINKLVEQMNKPFKQVHDNWNPETHAMEKKLFTFPNPVFAFHNIYNHIQDGVSDNDYVQQPVTSELSSSDPNWWADIMEKSSVDNSWYNWNNRNWGTKWDVGVGAEDKYPNTYIEGPTPNGENLVVYYNFNTAWSPPMPAMSKLSEQYPSLLFTLSYEEETGWGGECEFLRGKMISQSEYGWQCRDCEHTEEDTPYCEECDFDTCPSCGYNESSEPCKQHREEATV